MRYQRGLVPLLLVAFLEASCGMLGGVGHAEPFPIPTSSLEPNVDETLFAHMQHEGACLFLIPQDSTSGPSLLPIWADGFSATIGPRIDFLVFPVPLTEFGPIGSSELMELHGQYIETMPADVVVPTECVKYPLFLVRTAVSRS